MGQHVSRYWIIAVIWVIQLSILSTTSVAFFINTNVVIHQSLPFLRNKKPNQVSNHKHQRRYNSIRKAIHIDKDQEDKEEKAIITDDQLEQSGRTQLQQYFSFPIDSWQAIAGGNILLGNNVIVEAPTGAGKTVVGEMALHVAFQSNQNAIYTTPLKALSNQKFAELRKIFGSDNVGLATGDMSINRSARIMVMTTEVYRNMAWRAADKGSDIVVLDDEEKDPMSYTRSYPNIMEDHELSNTRVVVLDEFHYMGQKGRGGVWEEAVITSPRHIQLVGLSATLPNSLELSQWMTQTTQKKTCLVKASGGRPVPLRYMFATRDGLSSLFRNPDAGPGAPLGLLGLRGDGVPENQTKKKQKTSKYNSDRFDDIDDLNYDEMENRLPKGLQLNPGLKSMMQRRAEKVNQMIAKKTLAIDDGMKTDRWRGKRMDNDGGSKRWKNSEKQPIARAMSPKEERKERERLLKAEMRKAVPSLHYIVRCLKREKLLPAIFFIFSRAGCDEAMEAVCYDMKKQDKVKQIASIPSSKALDEKPPGKGRKTRQRAAKKQETIMMQDKQGRTFRTNSNYVTEDTFSSILDGSDMDIDIDVCNPLEETNLRGYSERGLLSLSEVKQAAQRIRVFNEMNPEIKFSDRVIDCMLHGVGSHHAGQLPAHKAFVESMFRSQFIKVVFATETLAAGINMPARTTVICSMAKRGDNASMNLLDTANTLQMAGRAGRRGMDTDGTCIMMATPFEGPEEAIEILTSEILPVVSQFSPSYSLIVNLIARGGGKIDVAQKLVRKSFAMWTKKQNEIEVDKAKSALSTENFDQIVEEAAHEQFLDRLKEMSADYRDQRVKNVLEDKNLLKKASKSFSGLYQILNLEENTLAYLRKELDSIQTLERTEQNEMDAFIFEDKANIEAEIMTQQKRIRMASRDVGEHVMTSMAVLANSIISNKEDGSEELRISLLMSRKYDEEIEKDSLVTPIELCKYAKSAVTMNRKRRKQNIETKNIGIDKVTLLDRLNMIEDEKDDLDDLRGLVNVLQDYGCIVSNDPKCTEIKNQSFKITTAGENVGLLGLENALWVLAAMGGAWDVTGASAELDRFKQEISKIVDFDSDGLFEDEYTSDLFSDDNVSSTKPQQEGSEASAATISLPQSEANSLSDWLQNMEAHEMAGYVSCLVSDSRRDTSVLSAFQQLTPTQQRVVQNALLASERLTEIQNKNNIDPSMSKVHLELSTCEVVTAWTEGCSWSEALKISGLAPGDLVRTLHRALDALRQIGNLPINPERPISTVPLKESPGIHPAVRRLCREAASAMDRYPVKDPLPFDEEDTEDEEDEEDSEEDTSDKLEQ